MALDSLQRLASLDSLQITTRFIGLAVNDLMAAMYLFTDTDTDTDHRHRPGLFGDLSVARNLLPGSAEFHPY